MANFNSHAHAGRDADKIVDSIQSLISTHTPTRGVTERHKGTLKNEYDFNSHAHAGRDTRMILTYMILIISTHTPTRGVTNRGSGKNS